VLYALSHFVAITAWVFGMTKLPDLPREGRAPYFAGFAVTLTVFNMGVAAAAWVAAAKLPPLAAAGLVLLMPLYFALSLWHAARHNPTERLALIFGMAIAPAMHALAPSLDLLLTGLVGGLAAAYFIGSRAKPAATEATPPELDPAAVAALADVAPGGEEKR
jgi:predicted branched-subunit amino acid permease